MKFILYKCVCFVLDDELHDHLLRVNKCESVNRGGQCGSGILSYGVLRKLQSKVRNQAEFKFCIESENNLSVKDAKSQGMSDCVTVFWICSTLSGGVSLLLWPQRSQTHVGVYLCRAVGGWQIIYSLKGAAESDFSKEVVAFSCQVVSAGTCTW